METTIIFDQIKEDIKRITLKIHEDPEYSWAWFCAISVPLQDVTIDRYAANQATAWFMKQMFGIDMFKHPYWEK